MPRTTHPTPRHRHERGRLRYETDRIVAARRRAVRHQVDDRIGGGWSDVGLPRLLLEDYLAAGADEVRRRGGESRLSAWAWVRVRQLADRRDAFGYGHDCGWSSDWCDVCRPPRARDRRALEAEVARLVAADGGWRAELGEGPLAEVAPGTGP